MSRVVAKIATVASTEMEHDWIELLIINKRREEEEENETDAEERNSRCPQ